MRKSFENISLDNPLGTALLGQGEKSVNKQISGHKDLSQEKEEETSVIENLGNSQYLKNQGASFETTEPSPDSKTGTSIAPSQLLNDILRYDLKNYLQEKLAERTSFFRKVSYENIMKWQGKEISEPLLKLPIELQSVGVQLFRNLLSYMGDRKSSKKSIEHAKKHLKLTLTSNDQLKDEAYVQVLKQIKDNPNYDHCLFGWNFFAILASVFAPSTELYNSILNYLFFEIQNNTDKIIVSHANYVFVRLFKVKDNPRSNIPSEEELRHIEFMKPIKVPIFFFTGTSVDVLIESYTTVKELKVNLMSTLQFNVNRAPYYCLYEICSKKDKLEERFLEDSERMCDVLSLWKKDIEKSTKLKEPIGFKLFLKLFLYFPFSESDVDSVSVVYYQAMYDVINGKFNLMEDEIITLAALQLLIEFSSNQDRAYQNLQKNLDLYIPMNRILLYPAVQWVQKIMEMYSTLSSFSKLDAKINYLDQLKKSPLWEAQQFDAKYSKKNIENPDNLPEDLVIGIKPNGISIFDTDRNELTFYPYEVIMNWGISEKQFVLNVSRVEGQIVKHYFDLTQTKIIQSLVESYTNLMAGKSIVEVQNITDDYSRRFHSLVTGRKREVSTYKKAEESSQIQMH